MRNPSHGSGETPEEYDDRIRGEGYTARCAYWESLTEDQVYGRAPLPEYVPPAAVEAPPPARRRPA